MKRASNVELQSNGMSSLAASFTSTQNGLEKWKLSRELQQIECEEYFTRVNNVREIHKLKDLVLEYIATGCVYKQHRFERYDPFRKEEKSKERIEKQRRIHRQKIQSEVYSNKPKEIKAKKIQSKLERSKTMIEEISQDGRQPSRGRIHQSLPDITRPIQNVSINDDLIGREDKTGSDDKSVFYQVQNSRVVESDAEDTRSKKSVSFLPTIKRVALWEQQQVDQKDEETRERIRHKKYQPNLKEEFQRMFPGNCKTSYSMRKFIDKETKNVLHDIDNNPRKFSRREQDSLIKKSQLPDFIDRHKTTSAILRDFRSIKRNLKGDDELHKQPDKNEKYNQIIRFLELAESFEQ
ncbi:uncharacterized protein LOC111109781 [Crassostrea virginica]